MALEACRTANCGVIRAIHSQGMRESRMLVIPLIEEAGDMFDNQVDALMDGVGSNIQRLISLDMGDMKEMAAAGTKMVFDMLPKG